MSAINIRGNFVTLLAQVEDPAILQLMFEQCIGAQLFEDVLIF